MSDFIFDYKQYRKNLNKPNFSVMPILIVVILILLSVAFVLYKNITNKKINEQTFFFVQLDEVSTYKEASVLACEIQSKGGAGYIYFDGKYHILINFYPSESEAEKVVTNLKENYEKTTIFKLVCRYSSIKDFQEINDKINKLSNLNISFDKSEISFKKIEQETHLITEEFRSFYKNNKDNQTKETTKLYFNKLLTDFEEFISIEEDNFSMQFKYKLIKLVIDYSSFLSCF